MHLFLVDILCYYNRITAFIVENSRDGSYRSEAHSRVTETYRARGKGETSEEWECMIHRTTDDTMNDINNMLEKILGSGTPRISFRAQDA